MWRHANTNDGIEVHFAQENCVFCHSKLLTESIDNQWPLDENMLRIEHIDSIDDSTSHLGDTLVPYRSIESDFVIDEMNFKCCPACGWWCISQWVVYETPGMPFLAHQSAAGALYHRRYPEITAPLSEIRSYLCARYDYRFQIDPFVLERVVNDVFLSCGCSVQVSSRSRDGGIDVFGRDQDGEPFGVQVKRHKNKIGVSQVREFLGSLVLGRLPNGVFVTTSEFTQGAKGVATSTLPGGIRLSLRDADALFEMLQVAQIRDFDTSKVTQLAQTYCRLVDGLSYDGCMPMNSY